jgi:hypothetical protein
MTSLGAATNHRVRSCRPQRSGSAFSARLSPFSIQAARSIVPEDPLRAVDVQTVGSTNGSTGIRLRVRTRDACLRSPPSCQAPDGRFRHPAASVLPHLSRSDQAGRQSRASCRLAQRLSDDFVLRVISQSRRPRLIDRIEICVAHFVGNVIRGPNQLHRLSVQPLVSLFYRSFGLAAQILRFLRCVPNLGSKGQLVSKCESRRWPFTPECNRTGRR